MNTNQATQLQRDWLEAYMKDKKYDETAIPEWAHRLMKDRYGMKLHV